MIPATSAFEAMAKAKGLVLPEVDKAPVPGKKTVVWNGRAMELVEDGSEHSKETKFTYHSGEQMVACKETPATSSTKLIHGDFRAINTPAPTPAGNCWKPGCRYSNRNKKLDNHVEGEEILSNGKFTAYLTDDDNVHFKSGRILWKEERFRNCPGRVGHAQYENMCNILRRTSHWQDARPQSRFAPGFAEYTKRTPEQISSDQSKKGPVPPATEGTYRVREEDGSVVTVPETAALAQDFDAVRLIPAALGAIPNGPASFSIHTTPTDDLRWLSRTVAQRNAAHVPIRGPGSVEFLENCGKRGNTMTATAAASLRIA